MPDPHTKFLTMPARRREDASFRISAASWNRSVASLAKLYAWA